MFSPIRIMRQERSNKKSEVKRSTGAPQSNATKHMDHFRANASIGFPAAANLHRHLSLYMAGTGRIIERKIWHLWHRAHSSMASTLRSPSTHWLLKHR